MKQICFLIPDATIKPGSLFSAIEVLDAANWFYNQKQRPHFYEVVIVCVNQSNAKSYSDITGRRVFSDFRKLKPDIIIIPGLQEDRHYGEQRNLSALRWISNKHKGGAEIISLCTGAFFLAETGLLNGKECSTHWNAAATFSRLFPEVTVNAEKIMTDSNGIYTAGGANSSLNVLLYIVEKYSGRQAALFCAKMLAIDLDRDSQAHFMLFEGQRQHRDEAIKKAQNYIERNYADKITVDHLAAKFNLSKRSFIRRFKVATENVPSEYIQKVRVEAAKRTLESKQKNITEVMYSVGYNDAKAFRNLFRRVTGLSPADYKAKFAK